MKIALFFRFLEKNMGSSDLLLQAGGGMKWCEGNDTVDLGSSCFQRILIDGLNLIFLLAYLLSLIITKLRKGRNPGCRNRDWAILIVSVISGAVGVAYIGCFSWLIIGEGDDSLKYHYLFGGLIWVFIAISLNFRPSRLVGMLCSAWWVSFSLLITAFDLKILLHDHDLLPLMEITSWVVSLMLIFCAIRVVYLLFRSNNSGEEATQPLLIGEERTADGVRRRRYSSVSFISKLTFSWLNDLLRSGYTNPLDLNDVPELDSDDDAGLAFETFAKAFEYQRKNRTKSAATNLALFALARCYTMEMVLVGLYALLKTISVVASPLLLYGFIDYSNRKNRELRQGMVLIVSLVVAKVVESLSQRHCFFDSRRYGMRMRSGLMAAVYRKLLKLSSTGRRKHSTGEIVNYIAVDAYRLGEFPWWFHMGWSLPLQMILSVAVLLRVAGLGAALGLIPLIIVALLNFPMGKILQKCQYHFMVAQDERLRSTSEILNSMKIIKVQSWEEHFRRVIEGYRDVEFKWLKETQIKKSFGTGLYWMSPTLVSAMVLAGCALIGSAPLNATTIFTVLAILRVMAEPVRLLPEALSVMIQVKVSLDRLDIFLLEDEIREDDVRRNPDQFQKPKTTIAIHTGDFSWDSDETNLTLKGVNLKISRGQKVAVCGPVGAGKSSILSSILGEIPRISGSVEIYGSIAYVPQTAWIQSGTVRDNILYGKQMNTARYEMVIRACALDKDINNFSHGDMTEIGQRGLNMSGGQKQRIQLARALYSDADVYLLDDPFSAVDAHTAAILFNDYVMTALNEKTVVLVTHQIEFLTEMNKILVMRNGEITQEGTYEELLLKTGTEFEKLVDAHHQSEMATTINPVTNLEIQEESTRAGTELQESDSNNNNNPSRHQTEGGEISAVQLTEEERKEIGDGGWKSYLDYIRFSKIQLHLTGVILTQLGFVLLQTLSTYWLAVAVEMVPSVDPGILVGTYTIISFLSCAFVSLRAWISAVMGLEASKAFFSGFMDSVFKAPMLFFDSTPVGRILTRASSDMSVLDFDIPFAISFVLAVSIEIPGTIVLMAAVTWQILIAAIPVMVAMLYVQRYYLASARELVRINGTTKAPVMNYAAETSLGVATIRAFSAIGSFIDNNLKLINTDATLFFHTIGALEWVLLRVEALQNVTILTTAFVLVLLPEDTIAPGFVGLSLSYALSLTSSQTFFTRWYSNLDNYIISVERIKQFMYLQPEALAVIPENRPPSSWPYEGKIELQDLKIRYRPNAPLVLKGISCTFAAGEKVGVVGRTGSGKTTLIGALFRLVEPAGGSILIDQLDICSIGLKDLRMKLSIIPQEPTLFKGSVRKNLDPLGLHSDHEIWEALDKCQLKSTISNLPNLLDSSVSDEGENWSVGQRQLFCLGRVLLRRNKILVLDEATASVDSATDATLQKIIREEFSSCTVVTVAHRVPTVMDSDMVMVLSYGNLVEYDRPSNLMGTNSSFSKLVAEYWSNCRRKSTQNFSNL